MTADKVKRVKLILNPTAGHGRGRKEMERILSALRSYDIKVEIAITEYHEHATELAEQTDVSQFDALLVAGGDGTVYQAMNGLMSLPEDQRIPLGIIPIGTGNAGAWDTAGVRNIDDAVEIISKGKRRKVDVGTFLMDHHTYYFLNVIGVGFVADVGMHAVNMKWLGEVAYTFGVLWETVFLKAHHMHFEMDGNQFDEQGLFVEFCNTRYTAADMMIAPDAKIDDGYLDVVVCKDTNRRTLLRSFPKVFKGTHTELPIIDIYKAQSIKLWTEEPKVLIPDGELFGRTPIEVGILPQAIEIYSGVGE